MPSSTSNSEFESEYQTLSSSDRFSVALKTLAVGILIFGSVVLIYSSLAGALNLSGRIEQQVDYLPQFASQNKDKQKVMVIGSSMIQAGFEPTVFDAVLNSRGIDSLSYNYGSGNLDPEFQEIISRRIRSYFEQENEKLALTLVEFNPFQATKVRNLFGDITRDQNHALLMSTGELWNIVLRDPTRGVRLFNIRYLRNSLSAELLTSALFIVPQFAPTEEYLEASNRQSLMAQRFRETLSQPISIAGSGSWKLDLRGGRIDKSVLSAESLLALGEWYASSRDTALMQADLQRRIDQGDILDLDFEEALIAAFIALVNNLEPISESIEIILLPRNTDWVNYAPAVQARLDAILRHIEDQTGVSVRNLQVDPRITPAHFVDTTHLSAFDGIDIFSAVLAEEYEATLRGIAD